MYHYGLEKGSKKHICPECAKKRFVLYVNTVTGEYLNSNVGRCDREVNCGYHYSPKQYFQDNNIDAKPFYSGIAEQKVIIPAQKPLSYISHDVVRRTLRNYESNNFISYLNTLFSEDVVDKLIERFQIGTSKYWKGATVFWQIDENKKVRSGKIILYEQHAGKRTKKINWAHSVLKLPDFNLQQCLFGLHQLPLFKGKAIGIVESEKTAIIMTGLGLEEDILSNFVWMSTGSVSMLKKEMLQALKDRTVVLYPDLGLDKTEKGTPYDQWKSKLPELVKMFNQISISDLLENKASEEQRYQGLDIADFVITELNNKNRAVNHLKSINPVLLKLISSFNLEIEQQSL